MSDAILDLIDSLYSEYIITSPDTNYDSFIAGAEAVITYLIDNNKL